MAFNTSPSKPQRRRPTMRTPPSVPLRFITSFLPAFLLIVHLPGPTNAASITNGPLAPVTIAVSNKAWSTARDCAKNCLEYAGIWKCGYNAGYFGLGAGLGCGCASTNGCYCNTAYASSATSWISSCVSAHCEPVIGTAWGGDLDGMLGLYDGYCKTANVEGSVGASWTPSTKTATGAVGGGSTGAATAGAGANGGPVETGESASVGGNGGGGGGEKQGLSQSDIVALAASLGVGIPSLLIAGITLWVQLKKKRKRRQSVAVAGGGTGGGGGGGYVSSDSSIISTQGQQQLGTDVRQLHNGTHYDAGYNHMSGAVPGVGVGGQQGRGYYYDAAPVGQNGQYGQGLVHQDAGGGGWFGYTK